MDCNFRGRSAVKGIEQLGIRQKHRFLVFPGRYGVVDILEPIRFGELVADKKIPSGQRARIGMTC